MITIHRFVRNQCRSAKKLSILSFCIIIVLFSGLIWVHPSFYSMQYEIGMRVDDVVFPKHFSGCSWYHWPFWAEKCRSSYLRTICSTNRTLPITEALVTEISLAAEQSHVDISLGSGGILGAVRDKGIIPFDSDVDILVWISHVPKMLEVLKALQQRHPGTMLGAKASGWGLYVPGALTIDLKIVHEVDGNVLLADPFAMEMGPKNRMELLWWKSRGKVPFGDGWAFSLKDQHAFLYLTRFYGNDWNIPKAWRTLGTCPGGYKMELHKSYCAHVTTLEPFMCHRLPPY